MSREPEQPLVFVLAAQIPSGKNAVQITRTGKRYPNERFKAWRDAALAQIGDARSFEGPVAMAVAYTPRDKIRRDVPGLLDALCHLIERAGIVHDDAQVKNVAWTTFPPEKNRASCWVKISSLRREGYEEE